MVVREDLLGPPVGKETAGLSASSVIAVDSAFL